MYCNNDIIEMTYKCSLRALEFRGDTLVKHFEDDKRRAVSFSVEEQNMQRTVEEWFTNILVIWSAVTKL